MVFLEQLLYIQLVVALLSFDSTLVSSTSPGNGANTRTFPSYQWTYLYGAWYLSFQVTWTSISFYYIQNYYAILSPDYSKFNGQFYDNSVQSSSFPMHFDATQYPSTANQGTQPLPPNSFEGGIWSTLTLGYVGLFFPSFPSIQRDNYYLPYYVNAYTVQLISSLSFNEIYNGQYYGVTATGSPLTNWTALIADGNGETWIHGSYRDGNSIYNFDGINSFNGDYVNYCPGTGTYKISVLGNGWPGSLNLQISGTTIQSGWISMANGQIPNGQQQTNQETITNFQQIQRSYACYLYFYRPGPQQYYYAIWNGKSVHGAFWEVGYPNFYPFDGYVFFFFFFFILLFFF